MILVSWLFVYHQLKYYYHSSTSEVYKFLNIFSFLVTFQKVLSTFMVFVITLEVCSHEQRKRVNFTIFKVKSTLIVLNRYLNPLISHDYP
jgi:hypothetical protein